MPRRILSEGALIGFRVVVRIMFSTRCYCCVASRPRFRRRDFTARDPPYFKSSVLRRKLWELNGRQPAVLPSRKTTPHVLPTHSQRDGR